MKKTVLLAMLFLATFTRSATAEDREWVPYKKFVESSYLDKFYSAPANQRDKLKLLVKVTPVNKAISVSNIALSVMHSGGKELIPINADGVVNLIPNRGWMKENPMIYTSMPKGEKTSISVTFAAKAPENLRFNYVALMGSVRQWNELINEYAGLLRFVAPKLNGIELHFAKPAQQTLQLMTKEGVKTFTADAKGSLKVKLDETWMKDDPQIVLSEHPVEIEVSDL